MSVLVPGNSSEGGVMLRQYNYVFLLGGLLFMLLGGSLGVESPYVSTRVVMDITLFSVFILGVWSLVNSKIAFVTGWVLAGLTFTLTITAQLTEILLLQYLALAAVLVFFFLSCIIAVYDVLFGGTIDINRLIGAGCIYLLSGAIWGIVYFLLSVIAPASFDGINGETWSEQLNEFTYHSFVTLTTLGYGDVTPVAPVARTLCYLEAVLGQLYLTVLVAALVGMHIANRRLVCPPEKAASGT
jgi:voltage-gated potassium channel